MMVRQLSAVVVVLGALAVSSTTRAERVGYSFTGTLTVPGGPTQSWFGEPLVSPPPSLAGTLTYDTTAHGDLSGSGYGEERIYRELITGGLKLDVDFGSKHVVVEVSDYDIKVRNDFASGNPELPPLDMFLVSYDYPQGALSPPRQRAVVNGTEWTGPFAYIVLALSWDYTKFGSETALVAGRPTDDPQNIMAYTGTQGLASYIDPISCCSAVIPQVGDYNYDGKVNTDDYTEWRRCYGSSDVSCMAAADGNHDGVVDAGDYIILEHAEAMSGQSALSQISSVPEPACMVLAFFACFGLTGVRRRRSLCRNIV
jgi:hypothetical protein